MMIINCPISPFMCPITQKPGAEVQIEVVVPPEVLPEVKLEVSILPNISSDLILSGGNTLVQFPVPPVGASLQGNWENWETVGASPKVVKKLRVGFHIPFITCPPVTLEPRFFQPPHCPVKRELLKQNKQFTRSPQALRDSTAGCFWFPSLKWRPVIDLSSLNTFIKCPKFIMETPEQIRLAIQANDWVTSLDLSDAYLHVPIHPSCRKYLRFAYQGQVWEFRALPYGLSPAPWLFTLIALEVKALAQRNGILMHIYLDDWLLRSQSRRILTKQTLWIQKMCRYLGLQINMAKSELNPSQDFVFLGYRFQTLSHRVLPSHKRVQAIYEMAHRFIQRDPNTVRSWMSLLGLLSATEKKLVPMGRLHLRNIQHCLKGQWNVKLHSLHSGVQLSQSALTDLRWWMMSKHVLASCPTHP